MPKYIMTKEGKVVEVPGVPEPEPVAEEPEPMPETPEPVFERPEVEPEPEEKDELADLFEVPQPEDNDMVTDHLTRIGEEDDMSDLVEVTEEDIMGEAPEEPEPPKPRFRIRPRGRRVIRREPPPTSLGGVRY